MILPLVTLANVAAFISAFTSLTDTLIKFRFIIYNILKSMAYLTFIISVLPMVQKPLKNRDYVSGI